MCNLRSNPGYGRCLRQLDDSALRLDKGQILEKDRYHGCLWQISSQYLWRCPDTPAPEDAASGYIRMQAAGWQWEVRISFALLKARRKWKYLSHHRKRWGSENTFRAIKSKLEIRRSGRGITGERTGSALMLSSAGWLWWLVRIVENENAQSRRKEWKKLARLRFGEFIFYSGRVKIVSEPNPHQLKMLN